MKRELIFGFALCTILVTGCVTNQSSKNLPNNSNAATVPSLSKIASATPVAKIESQSKTPIKEDVFMADIRKESTGLLGKTVTSKKKFSKNWGGELEYFNNYAQFPVDVKIVFPNKIKIWNLVPEQRNKTKEFFALVKEDNKTAYFIDLLEISVPKGYLISYDTCTIGVVGLFKIISSSSQILKKPEKAWTVVNGRFIAMTNFSKMECQDNSSGD